MDLKSLIICLKEVKKLGNSEEVLLLDHMQEAAISKCPPSLQTTNIFLIFGKTFIVVCCDILANISF